MILPRPRSLPLIVVLLSLPAMTLAQNPVVGGGELQILAADGKPAGVCPLKHTDVTADIAGFVGRVTVRQTFHNPTDSKIEAVYVFPLPQHAAVDDMVMTVGDRRIVGQIKPRDEAREIYEAAKLAGHVASLLDQERPNIFTQSIANIEPGVEVVIEISYVETLKYDEGVFEWVFPMVVGPRYIPGGGSAPAPMTKGQDTQQVPDGSKITPPIARKGTRAGHDISLIVSIDAGMELHDLASVLHVVEVETLEPGRAVVSLRNQATIPNKDFMLRFRLAADEIGDAFLVHSDERGSFFTLVLQPPRRIIPEKLMRRELIFVLDTSGSMRGFPIEKAKQTMSKLIDTMHEGDTFNIITFAGNTRILWDSPRPSTPDNREEAQQFLASRRGGGGTEMMKAINAALKPNRHVMWAPTPGEGIFQAATVAGLGRSHPTGAPVRVVVEWTRYRVDKQADRTWLLLPDGGRIAATRFTIDDPKVTCKVGESVLLEGIWKMNGDERLLEVRSARYANFSKNTRPWFSAVQLADWVGDGSSITVYHLATDIEVLGQDGAAPGLVNLPTGPGAPVRAQITHWELPEGPFQPRPGQWVELRGSLMKADGKKPVFQVGYAVWPVRPSGVAGVFQPPGVLSVEETAEILYEPRDPNPPYERRLRAEFAGDRPPVSNTITVEGRWSTALPARIPRASGNTGRYLLSNDGSVALAIATLRADLTPPADGQRVRVTGRVAMTAVGDVLQAEKIDPLPIEPVPTYTPEQLAKTAADARIVRLRVARSRCESWPPPNVRASWTGVLIRLDDGSTVGVAQHPWPDNKPDGADGDEMVLFEGRWTGAKWPVLRPLTGWDALSTRHPPAAPIRVVCFMTDGYVGNDMAIIDAVRKNADTTRVFSFGVGNSVNRFLLDGMAHAGRGEVEYVSLASQADAAVERFHERILAPVLTGIEIDWGDLPVADVYPTLIPDLFAAKPIMIHGRLTGPAIGTIRLSGDTGAGFFQREIDVSAEPQGQSTNEVVEHPALASLWARAAVSELMNQDLAALQTGNFPEPLKNQITNLGVEFRIMTQFTSFVAVEELTVTVAGEAVRIDVPVEMPDGVSYEGVFGDRDARKAGFAGRARYRKDALNRPVVRTEAPISPSAQPPAAAAAGGGALREDDEAGSRDAKQENSADKLADSLRGLSEKVAKEGRDGTLAVGKLRIVDYKLDVMIFLRDTSTETLKALKKLGFVQTAESKAVRLLIGSVDIRKLDELVKLDAVIRVRPVVAP